MTHEHKIGARATIPVEPTYEMCIAGGFPWEVPHFPSRYKAMIAAAPNGSGKLTKADVEKAAYAICDLFNIPPDAPLTNNHECTVSALEGQIPTVKAVAAAFGLEVED